MTLQHRLAKTLEYGGLAQLELILSEADHVRSQIDTLVRKLDGGK
jgi:hypothetical protein